MALVLLLLLQACSAPPAPIDRRASPPSERINYHIVSRGDTLFSIAWRYEKDLEKLAAVNNLSASYTIYPGQRLSLDTSSAALSRSRTSRASEPNTAKSRIQKRQTIAKSTPVTRSTSPPKAAIATGTKYPEQISWRWPVRGKLASRYRAGGLFKGIDINSLPGSEVVASAPGSVVYAGNGLRGYGNLIIIRHNSVFLSAYAHNRRIFVREGAAVKAGQKIAEVGGDPANVRRFYFEIRKDGKPVNPLNYLPKN